jgi:predicted RND superfamily exporter protein
MLTLVSLKPGFQAWANRVSRPIAMSMSVPPMPERKKGAMVGLLLVVVLLLVVMPVLIYSIGWGVTRYTKKAPSWIGFPMRQPPPSNRPEGTAPARLKA